MYIYDVVLIVGETEVIINKININISNNYTHFYTKILIIIHLISTKLPFAWGFGVLIVVDPN